MTNSPNETILKHLKRKRYVVEMGQLYVERCCVCQVKLVGMLMNKA
ncbi:hypothetical protein HanXRQr2_Chr13g0578181 [Helianthus annuus]|uniref:Uncharacterized protein n=1 Tax=Helianthus annuus TaxID=4232 RepID=A0A9K3EGL3_HELAN|nr:hypothetical protein HanXRQr2_Chr13g0578181 [Helianthus annuus]